MRNEANDFFSQSFIKPVLRENAPGEIQSGVGRHAGQVLQDLVDGAPAGHGRIGANVTARTAPGPNLDEQYPDF